ncbi:MAG: FkbM family methyltransferase [Chloroflexota bacterium]
MQTKLVQTIFRYRRLPKRIIRTLFPQPIRLRLDGFDIFVRLDDWAVGARIAVKRSYETHVTEAIRPYLQPGIVFVDVGANIGYYTLLAASRLGPTGKIFAFEPGSANCALLQKSVAHNGFGIVQLFPNAVADTTRTVGLRMDDSNGVIEATNPSEAMEMVTAVPLDEALADQPRIDVIKMDIEGAEGLALRGAIQLLRQHRPVLFTEFRPPSIASRSQMAGDTFLNQLREIGYELRVIHRQGGPHPTPQSNAEIMACFAQVSPTHLDLLAVSSQT